MRAVVLTGPNQLKLVSDWPEPEAGKGEVVVRIRAVGLCGTDTAAYRGVLALPAFPWIIGHEGGGEIVAVGQGVTDRRIGDRVVIEPNYACAKCEACRRGITSECQSRIGVGFAATGLLAERVAVPAQYTWPAEGMSDAALACFEPLAVADAAIRRSRPESGMRCLVVGAGSVGALACHSLQALGAEVYTAEPNNERRAIVEEWGVQSHTEGDTYPLVIETSGAPAAWSTAFSSVARGGSLTLIGFGRTHVEILPQDIVRRQLNIHGHMVYDHPSDFASTMAAVAEGRLNPAAAAIHRFNIEETPEAFAHVNDRPGKTWIDFGQWFTE